MTTANTYGSKNLDSIYGSQKSATLSDQGAAVMDIMKELDIPPHKDEKLRSMLLELDGYKNMPNKYYEALSKVLAQAIDSRSAMANQRPNA
jgi:type III secretion system FlhB-like substrate exporter